MINFRLYYDTFYRDQIPCITTADEMRGVIKAYKEFRLYQGLNDTLDDAEHEAAFAARMEYHIGACELAELSGDKEKAVKHREAFLEVWKLWFQEISGEKHRTPGSEPGRPGFWERIRQAVRNLGKWSENKRIM